MVWNFLRVQVFNCSKGNLIKERKVCFRRLVQVIGVYNVLHRNTYCETLITNTCLVN